MLSLTDMSESDKLFKYIEGLKYKTKMEVYLREPSSLEDAIRLAEKVDQFLGNYNKINFKSRNLVSSESIYAPAPTTTSSRTLSYSTPMDIGMIRITRKKLTDQEREQLRLIGACYKCRQKGHISRNCPENISLKSNQIASINLDNTSLYEGNDKSQ
jgi:hypothetical protein